MTTTTTATSFNIKTRIDSQHCEHSRIELSRMNTNRQRGNTMRAQPFVTFQHSLCWTKLRTTKKLLCIVCYSYRSISMYSNTYCCSTLSKHSQRRICDTCVHQHIRSKLSSCLISSVPCPEMNCQANLNPLVICHILLKHDSDQLLDEYLREQQWQGKNEEWIKRFATPCPGCHVPIEKNGGCDEMLCTRCQTHFYWSKARRCGDSDDHDEKCNYRLLRSKNSFSIRCFLLLSSFIIIFVLLSYTIS